jgi:hypothetical protein
MHFRFQVPFLAGLLLAVPASAQPVPSIEPSNTHIFPAGGKRGTTVKVRVGGECWPPGMNFQIVGDGLTGPEVLGPLVKPRYEPSLRRVPRDADGGLAGMSYPREFEATLTIADNAEAGMRFWRVWGGWGGTKLRPFLVGDLPEFIETEPNSQADQAERVTLPVVLNGQIAGERDQDFFVFHVKAGQTVVCDVMAARIGSPLEPVIAITGPQGNRVEVDELRVGTDPLFSFRAAADGDYRLHVANLSFYGGPAYVYRITLTTGPYAAFAFPPGGRAGTTSEVEVFTPTGTGTFGASKEQVTFPARPGPFHFRDGLVLVAGELPEMAATPSHQSLRTARELALPVTVNGRFLKAGAEDWYRFRAKKDEHFAVACQANPQASAAVPTLAIVGPDGATLAQAASAETPEHRLEVNWKAPADGDYALRVRDLQGSAGGPEFIYRLTVRPAQPSLGLRLLQDYVNVVQGGKTALDLEVTRAGGLTGPIELSVPGLPEGVSIEPTRLAEGQTRVKLTFLAKPDARPTNAAVQLVGSATSSGQVVKGWAVVSSYGVEASTLHLTIQHKPVFRLSCKETYQYAPAGSIHPYLMKIERFDGFDGPIVLQLCDRQVQDLDGVDILEQVIPPGATEVMNRIYFPEAMHAGVQAHSRPYAQAYAAFTDKWGQKQTLLSVSTHRCMVRTLPPVVKLRAETKEIAARPGETVECRLVVERAAFNGPLDVALLEAPGFAADPVHVEAGQSELTIRVRLTSEPQAGDRALQFRATGRLETGQTARTEASVPVRIK